MVSILAVSDVVHIQEYNVRPGITIELPKPVSANVYWKRGRSGIIYTSPKARAYKQSVLACWLESGHAMLSGSLAVTLHCYICLDKADMPNWEKVTLDALQGCAYEDDNCVVELHMYRHKVKHLKDQKVIVTLQQVNYDGK